MIESTSKRRTGGRPWWEARRCELCEAKIGKLQAWDEPPRLVDEYGQTVSGRSVSREALPAVLRTHRLFCTLCWRNRWGEALTLARTPRPASGATG